MRRSFFFAISAALVLITCSAFGQDYGRGGRTPRDGACFYRESGFRGPVFCVNAGEYLNGVPNDFDDRISSIQIFGRASVTVFDDHNFRGNNDRLDQSAPDLQAIRKSADRNHTWNNRISSVRVDWVGGGRGRGRDDNWNGGRDDRGDNRDRYDDQGLRWGRGQQPRDGACFFRQPDFRGDYFCVERGRSVADLPREFNNTISSIRLFGNARVMMFSNQDFRGPRAEIGRDVRDLRDRRDRSNDWARDWDNRISSVQVR
jgi:hypothetical protein